MKEIPISDLMTTAVELVGPETPLREVISHMQGNRHSCTLIGEQDSPVGIITERDLIGVFKRALSEPTLVEKPASEFMTSPVMTLTSEQSLFDALVIARAERVRHLPVVDRLEKLVGLVTQTNLTEAHFHVIEKQRIIMERAVQDRTAELRNANRELESLSMEDALLGIGNRRAMEVDIVHTHSLAMRYERPYSVALLDIDHFKLYNDHYGHMAGDLALQMVTRVIRRAIRNSDRLYRYGGEEFLLLLPDTNASGGQLLAKRIVQTLFDADLPHVKSPYGKVTVSVGVGEHPQASDSESKHWQPVVKAADEALYAAKEAGRNRVA